MIDKRSKYNVIASVGQTISTALVYFFLYKIVLAQLGANNLGVWALVLSISASANFAALGVGSNVARLTSVSIENGQRENLFGIIWTSLFFTGTLFTATVLIVYLIAPTWLASANLAGDDLAMAERLVPYTLGCFFLNGISSVFLATIDGHQQNWLRSAILITGSALLFGVSFGLIGSMGLKGLAIAQLMQAAFQFLLGAFFCLRLLPKNTSFDWKIDRNVLRSMMHFGSRELVISLCQLFYDPFTKTMIGKFGSLSSVAYFEMANKLVQQLRGLIINANQVFMPVFAKMAVAENAKSKSIELYQRIFVGNYLLNLTWLAGLATVSMPFAMLWLGRADWEFLFFLGFLALANAANVQCGPAYFSNLGSGALRDNVVGNVVIFGVNVAACWSLGVLFGAKGAAIGWCLALAAGSMYIVWAYARKNGLTLGGFFQKWLVVPTASAAVQIAAAGLIFWEFGELSAFSLAALTILPYSGLLFLNLYPFRKRLFSMIKTSPAI